MEGRVRLSQEDTKGEAAMDHHECTDDDEGVCSDRPERCNASCGESGPWLCDEVTGAEVLVGSLTRLCGLQGQSAAA